MGKLRAQRGSQGGGVALVTVRDQVSLSLKDSDHGLVLCITQTSEHQNKGVLETTPP